MAQTVSGVVTEADGTPMVGVNVAIKGTSRGVTTNLDGQYKVEVASDATLIFSFIGFLGQEIAVDGRTAINVTMELDIETLNEVVVVGYGVQKKSDLTGAIASVDRDNLQQLATTSPMQALQGQVSGVQIVNNSGAPASGVKVRIRGVGTINNSDPLYIVDGYPTNDISNIPPSDIENMEVLKDASATAIYGSRGANGVIIITTRRGSQDGAQFEFNAYTGMQTAWNRLDLLNATEYAELRSEAFANDGLTPSTITTEKLGFVSENGNQGTDWQEEIFRPAPISNYNLSVRGGNEAFRYAVSGTYFGKEGIIENTYLDKIFTRANADFKLAEWLDGGFNFAYTWANYTGFNQSSYFSPLATALRKDPLTAPVDASTNTWDRSNLSDIVNPARLVDEMRGQATTDLRTQTGVFLNADLGAGFTLTTRFTWDQRNSNRQSYLPSYFITNNESRERSVLVNRDQEAISWVNSNFLNYNQDFGNHNVSATMGMEAYSNQWRYQEVQALDVPANPNLWFASASNAPDDITARDDAARNSILSYFGRATYSYNDRYLVTGTMRADGSSKFIGDNRWGYFPSFSAGWNLSNESFFPQNPILNYAKLRGGWGEVGNEGSVGAYEYLTLVEAGFNYTFGDALVSGAIPTRLANPSIRWETTRTTNFGVDLGLLDDRVIATVDYFDKQTLGMLYNQPVPGFAGAIGGAANIGDVRNTGWEFMLQYRQQLENMAFSVGVNGTHVRNTVVSLGNGEPLEIGFESKTGGTTTRTEEGEEIGYFYGLQTDGIFQSVDEINAYVNADGDLIQPNAQPGDVKYVDANGDGSIDFADDRVKLGSPFADWTFGLTGNLQMMGFDLNVLVQSSVGNEIANMMTYYLESGPAQENSLATRLDRWTPENPSATEPRVTTIDLNGNYLFSDRYIEDGSYVRLKNVQLGYTLPVSITEKVRLGSVRVYASADNLLTLTNYKGLDPEVGDYFNNPLHAGVDYATYPQARTVIFGCNLKF